MNEGRELLGAKFGPVLRIAIGGAAIVLFGSACFSGDTKPPQTSASSVPSSGHPETVPPVTSEQSEDTENNEKYKPHTVTATIYWIGEEATAENDFISNVTSAWDSNAVKRFGGVDSVTRSFEPRHNPYYFALPAGEFTEEGLIQGAREASPWNDEAELLTHSQSLFKGRWARITAGDSTVYAQWHDVGPNEEEDYDYVFGADKPDNTFGLKAGLDLSPEAASTLGFTDGGQLVTWEFVDAADVPDGPWRQYPAIDNITYWD